MAQGVPTPADVEIEFRTHYLRTGNIRASARQAKIPETTGQELATRAQADPAFVQARAAMYARALPDAERLLIGGMEIAADRLEAGPEAILSDVPGGAQKVTIQDPGPQYLRAIADGVKVLAMVRKAKDPEEGGATGTVTIVVRPTREAEARIEPADGEERRG